MENIYSVKTRKVTDGQFYECKNIINKSVRVFDENNNIIAIFVKDYFDYSEEEVKTYREIIEKHSGLSRFRGHAAGPIDTTIPYFNHYADGSAIKATRKIKETNGHTAKFEQGKMQVQNPVHSSAIGYYEASNRGVTKGKPDRLICGTESKDFDDFKKLFERADSGYSLYASDKWSHQYFCCQVGLHIEDTCFSTATLNKNFRTACHRDKGNFKEGFSVMPVFEIGSYSGGEIMMPEYDIAFNVREKDLFIFDPNQRHCNNEIWESDDDKKENERLGLEYPKNYIVGDEFRFSRLTAVLYLRQGLLHC